MRNVLLAATALFPLAAHAATYTVVAPGRDPGARQFASLAALTQAQRNRPFLRPGDVIQLPAGALAQGDNMDRGLSGVGTAFNPVTITAPPGQYTVVSNGGPTLANGKSPFTIYSSAVKINRVIFIGNYGGSNGNGAGIRMGVDYGSHGPNGKPLPYNLSVTNSAFIGNGDGILADDCSGTPRFHAVYGPRGDNSESGACTISIDHSEFASNGDGSGLTHNLYIDRVDQVTFTNNLSMTAFSGHLFKSRAFADDIENNRFFDGPLGYSNNDIDIPVGGNVTIKNNVIEKGPYGINAGTMIGYNEEEYWGQGVPNNPGVMLDIEGNTFIDNWSAAHPGSNSHILEDASWWTGKDSNRAYANQTNSPDPRNEVFTFANNKVFSPATNASNWCLWCWSKDALGAGNTFATSGAPGLNMTPPITWAPQTITEQLVVTMNGAQDDRNDYHNNPNSTDPLSFPNTVLWFNGMPLTPAPVVVRANMLATPPATQTLTYHVPVLVGIQNYLAATFLNPGCCIQPPIKGVGGRTLQWQSATLNGVVASPFPAGGIYGTASNPPAVFTAASPRPHG